MNNELLKALEDNGVDFAEGLSQFEFLKIEQVFDIKFPKDLKDFYSIALPISKNFYNWRDFSSENIKIIKYALDRPYKDIYRMVDEVYWCDDWGVEPDEDKRSKIIRHKLKKAPKLIPIYSHRYIPMIDRSNLPIFSICNTDVIYYGENLESYLYIEFGNRKQSEIDFGKINQVPFWSDLI